MFFILSKLLEFFLSPSNVIGLLGLTGIVALVLGWSRLARAFLVGSAAVLVIFGWAPVGPAALMVLENRFPEPKLDGPIAGIVMLGGAVDTHISSDRNTLTLNEAAERLTATLELGRRFPDARIFLSGGAAHLTGNAAMTESEVARNLLVAMGIAANRIEMEELSRNTCENATESAASLKPKLGETWLLVTSASHMPRSMACFRAAGFDITAYPVDYRTRGPADLKRPAETIAKGLEASDLAAHEWVGLVTYRAAGLTTELFPKP